MFQLEHILFFFKRILDSILHALPWASTFLTRLCKKKKSKINGAIKVSVMKGMRRDIYRNHKCRSCCTCIYLLNKICIKQRKCSLYNAVYHLSHKSCCRLHLPLYHAIESLTRDALLNRSKERFMCPYILFNSQLPSYNHRIESHMLIANRYFRLAIHPVHRYLLTKLLGHDNSSDYYPIDPLV